MTDHHLDEESPLYGDGPGAPWPPEPAEARPELPELLDRLGDELSTAASTVGRIADLLCDVRDRDRDPDLEPELAATGEEDLTRFDSLVVNTPKDDPYGADADLPAPTQSNTSPEATAVMPRGWQR